MIDAKKPNQAFSKFKGINADIHAIYNPLSHVENLSSIMLIQRKKTTRDSNATNKESCVW